MEAISTVFMHAYMRARTRAIVHSSPMVRMLDQRDQAFNDSVLLERELAIYRAHRQRCPAKERAHYSPGERAEILQVMQLRGWTAKRTAERFVLHPNTIRNWQKAIREKHRSERVVGAPPWNKLHEAVRWTVHEIRRLCPEREFGTRTIARHIVRAGIRISRTSVRRILEEEIAKPRGRDARGVRVRRPITNSAPVHLKHPRHPHHVWHTDITEFRVLWLRVHVVAIMDGFSRKIVVIRAFKRSVTTRQIIRLLGASIEETGCAPRFMITDHGCQFRRRFRRALDARGIVHARSPVGTWQFNAKIERFFRSLKFWQRRTLLVPNVRSIQNRLDAYRVWHNAHRPHAALVLQTPNEAEWSIKVPEPTAIRQRGDVEPAIQVTRQSVRGDPRLFYLNIDMELRKRFAA